MNNFDISRPTALVVIDMQRDFCSPGGYAHRAGLDVGRLSGPIANIGVLLDAARERNILIVHTREGHVPDLSDCPPAKLQRSIDAGAAIGSEGPMGRLLVRGEYGHDFIDELKPLPGETVIDKPGYSAFQRTRLQELLAEKKIEQLVVCGVTTEVCVQSTVREAIDIGYRCVTVSDATAASEPELQLPALAILGVEGGIFGLVAETGQLVEAFKHGGD